MQAAREKMQNKSFKAWINMHLAKHKLKVEVRRDATPGLGVRRVCVAEGYVN